MSAFPLWPANRVLYRALAPADSPVHDAAGVAVGEAVEDLEQVGLNAYNNTHGHASGKQTSHRHTDALVRKDPIVFGFLNPTHLNLGLRQHALVRLEVLLEVAVHELEHQVQPTLALDAVQQPATPCSKRTNAAARNFMVSTSWPDKLTLLDAWRYSLDDVGMPELLQQRDLAEGCARDAFILHLKADFLRTDDQEREQLRPNQSEHLSDIEPEKSTWRRSTLFPHLERYDASRLLVLCLVHHTVRALAEVPASILLDLLVPASTTGTLTTSADHSLARRCLCRRVSARSSPVHLEASRIGGPCLGVPRKSCQGHTR